jgi:hypothetical protein
VLTGRRTTIAYLKSHFHSFELLSMELTMKRSIDLTSIRGLMASAVFVIGFRSNSLQAA